MLCWWVSWTPPFRLPASPPPPIHTTMFPCIALVMPFSRDTLTELNMTLVRLSGAKSLPDPVVSQLLGESVASSPLARAQWSKATEVGYPSLIRDKQKDAVKQYASHLFLRTSLHIVGIVCVFGPGSRFFVLYMDLLTHGRGPRSQLRVPLVPPPIWPLASEDLSALTLGRLVSGTCKFFNIRFFVKPLRCP